MTIPPEVPAPRRADLPNPAAVQPADAATLAARGITTALLPLTEDPQLRTRLLLQLARALRHTLVDDHRVAPVAATTPRARLDPAIAQAMATVLPPDSPAEQIADLRLFAHLTLGECADLLGRPRFQLVQLWRPTRRLLFRWVRSNGSGHAIPQPSSDE